ncbi:MAG TPA: DUF5686 family protein [Sphingobacteriaceae bacterium]
MIKLFFTGFLLFFVTSAFSVNLSVSGRVTDENGNPVPFALVRIQPLNKLYSANESGYFKAAIPSGRYRFTYSNIDFKQLTADAEVLEDIFFNVVLEKEYFSPQADESMGAAIVRRVISQREVLLGQQGNYQCRIYTKGVQKLLAAPRRFFRDDVATILNVDAGERGILYQSETISELYYKSYKDKRELMFSSKQAGDHQGFIFNRALDLDVSFYSNLLHWAPLGNQWFISPVADNAFRYYNFQLVGSKPDNGRLIHKIRVLPKRTSDPVFRGFIYVMDGDWRLFQVDLYLTEPARINFVDTIRIRQHFTEVDRGVWKPASVTLETRGKVLGFDFAGYFAGVYNEYQKIGRFPETFLSNEVLRVDDDAGKKSREYWVQNRAIALTAAELRHYRVKDSLSAQALADGVVDSVQRLSNRFKPARFLVTGYKWGDHRNNYSWYVSSLKNTGYYNTTEGWGVRLKTGFYKQFSLRREVEVNHNLRYGFGNRMLSSNVDVNYRYDTVRHASIVFRIGTDFLDLNSRGTLNLFYNTITSLFGGRNYMQFYRSKFTSLYTQRELADGLIISVGGEIARRTPVFNVAYTPLFLSAGKMFTSGPRSVKEVDRSLFPANNAFTVETTASYTFARKYSLRPDGKVYEAARYPTLKVRYRKGIHGVLQSAVNYDFLSADLYQDKIRLGFNGFSSFYVSAGTFLNSHSLFYPDIHHFTGNQTAFYNPIFPNFHFLDYYTYSTNEKYLEAHYEHNFSGLITRRIPFLRKLKLEEIVGGAYLGQPQATYKEIYFGLQRLMFRVDYGFYWPTGQDMQHTFRLFYGF